jgi:MFS family permease
VTAFAPNKEAFIIFIALMGIGAAANTPAAFALITTHFPPGPLRGKAIGIMGAGQPLGFIIGIVLGRDNVFILAHRIADIPSICRRGSIAE